MMKLDEVVKCPHCGSDPTSAPVTAGELVANLQSDEAVTYYCEACEGPFTVEVRLQGPHPYHDEVKLTRGEQ